MTEHTTDATDADAAGTRDTEAPTGGELDALGQPDAATPEPEPTAALEPTATPEPEPIATPEPADGPVVADDVAADTLVPHASTPEAAGLGPVSHDPGVAAGVVPTTPDAPAGDDAAAHAPADAEPTEPAAPADAEPTEPAAPADAEPTEPAATGALPGQGEVTGSPEAVAAASAPAPRPTPRPAPRPVPRPTPRPAAAPAAATGVPAAPVAPPHDAAEAAHASTFGRVDDEGTVYVREASGERAVGQFPGATADEALALYVRRYLDLHAKVVLFEARLSSADLPPKEVDGTLAKLTDELAEPAAVGDLDGLRARLDGLRSVAAERRAAADAERAAAKEAAVAARTAIVEQAEKIAATDPERIQWRPAGEQLRKLLDEWKDAQRNGPRIDRPTEESLWKRFSHARTTFDRERRHFFAELEQRNASARAVKEALVAQAEKLATSTDWGATAGAYRELMAQWKASGRASRKEDDALWARFRAAQDAFFGARDAASAETDAEFRANLAVKEGLLEEAERLVPVRDLPAAKAALRSIQDRWDAAGKVPRGDLQRVEARLRAVESAVRDADQSAWTRGNPETRARAEGAASQLEAAIAGLEADLAAARADGDARRIADAQAALDARRAWLEQVRRAAQGS